MLARVARMEVARRAWSPSIGESKSSMRKMADATQIAQITIDKIDDRVAGREQAEHYKDHRQPRAHRAHQRPRDRVMRRFEQLAAGAQRLVHLS